MWPKACTVLDPFSGTGTVGEVCAKLQRNYIGNELNPQYIELQRARVYGAVFKYAALRRQQGLFDDPILEQYENV
jgi:DNA modification methylase